MDEDFMLWNFLEEERERYSGKEELTEAQQEFDEDEDNMSDDELMEKIAERLGMGITRQGGNY